MKKNENRAIIAPETIDVKDALVTIKTAAGTENIINQEDKTGAKISDKELEIMPWVLDRVANIENHLRRDFDAEAVKNNLSSFQSEQKQLDELKPIVAHLENSTTVRRTELKPAFAELYNAAKLTKDNNAAMAFIYEKMKPLYARQTSSSETKVVEKALEKEAFKIAKAAAKEALLAAQTVKKAG
jgi:hypothetical protein